MREKFTIGELADRAGVTAKTIRYYEKIDLLLPAERGDNNYRYYTDEQVYQLRFIRRAQRLGLTLNEIKDLMDLARETKCNELRASLDDLFARKIREYELKLAALHTFRQQLQPETSACVCEAFVLNCDCLPSVESA